MDAGSGSRLAGGFLAGPRVRYELALLGGGHPAGCRPRHGRNADHIVVSARRPRGDERRRADLADGAAPGGPERPQCRDGGGVPHGDDLLCDGLAAERVASGTVRPSLIRQLGKLAVGVRPVSYTHLSYAYGMASALRIDGRDDPEHGGRHVVAVVGDGALTGGLAYERCV